jgi:hypothetical protein
MKRILATVLAVAAIGVAVPVTAHADPPGPGSKQCIPGQNGNPHPGVKPPPSCPGNK